MCVAGSDVRRRRTSHCGLLPELKNVGNTHGGLHFCECQSCQTLQHVFRVVWWIGSAEDTFSEVAITVIVT